MFFKNVQIICLMTLLTKREEGQTLKIYCQEHRSSFYMEIIRKHDGQVSTYTWFCLDLSCIAPLFFFFFGGFYYIRVVHLRVNSYRSCIIVIWLSLNSRENIRHVCDLDLRNDQWLPDYNWHVGTSCSLYSAYQYAHNHLHYYSQCWEINYHHWQSNLLNPDHFQNFDRHWSW